VLAAAKQNDLATVRQLLSQKADPNYADKDGCTPLIVATGGCKYEADIGASGVITLTPTEGRGSTEMVKALLEGGAAPNLADGVGRTPLMRASGFGRTESVRALLDAHADPNLRDADGFAALHWACDTAGVEIFQLLLQHGASP